MGYMKDSILSRDGSELPAYQPTARAARRAAAGAHIDAAMAQYRAIDAALAARGLRVAQPTERGETVSIVIDGAPMSVPAVPA